MPISTFKKWLPLAVSIVFTFFQSAFAQELNNIGVNVNFEEDYSSDRAYADAMRVARAWYKPGGVTKANMDERGWPTEDAEIIVWHGIENMHGTYKLKFTGSASGIVATWVSATITNIIYTAATNTTTADLTINVSGALKLTFTGTSGGIKDVKLMKPIAPGSTTSYEFTDEFTTHFKEMLSKFKVVRFLNWSKTNGSTETAWNTRCPDDFCWGMAKTAGYSSGTSWESMIRLMNEINRDIWINIPVSATDDYVTQLATLFKNTLNPNLKIYVEYSNELWNTAGPFPQSGTNYTLAGLEVASGGSTLNFDGDANTWNWAWRRVAKKGVETSLLFRSVFGDAAMMDRVRPVLMWQKRNGQSVASQCLKWLDYYSQLNSKPIHYYFYGAGGSAYYSPDNASLLLTIDDIWASLEFDVATWKTATIKDALITTAMGVKRIAYEGGPGLDNLGTNGVVKNAAVLDPRMKTNMLNHHAAWSEQGGDLLCYFQTTGDAQWGLAADVLDLNTPKYQALNDLSVAPKAAINIGATLPFSLDGKAFDTNNSGATAGTGSYTLGGIDKWVGYLFRCDAGTYSFNIQYSGASTSTVQYLIDGTVLGTQVINGAATSTNVLMNLSAGLHQIRICQKSATSFSIVKANMNQVVTTPAPVIISPILTNTFKPGQTITANGTGDNLSWSISTVGGSVINAGTGQSNTFTVPIAAVNNSQIKIELTGGTSGTTIVSQTHTVVDDTPAIQAISKQSYVYTPISIQLSATGTGLPFTWTSTNLPSGITLTSSGLLSGTMNIPNTYAFNATVIDFDGDTHTKTLFLVVNNIPDVVLVEAENYTRQSGCTTSSAYGGASGNTYLDYGSTGTWGEWELYVNASQKYDITVTYANANAGTIRPAELAVNGVVFGSNDFAATGSWTTWVNVTFSGVTLNYLLNNLRLTATTANGGANIDKLTITKQATTTNATDYFRTSASGNWSNVATWQSSNDNNVWQSSGLTPTSSAALIQVMAGHELTVDGAETASALTVKAGGRLTLNSGATLTATNLSLKSSASDGTATFKNLGGTLTVSNAATVEQYLAYTRNWYISSPVTNALAPSGYTYYRRNEAGSSWNSVSVGAGLTPGVGYIALPTTAGFPITFTSQSGGNLNTGTISIPITYTTSATSNKGRNLIGNPYPCHITWNKAFTDANVSKIEPTIWYRTNSSTSNTGGWSFQTYNALSDLGSPIGTTGIIPPMQSFWVLAKQTTSIAFTNAMCSHQTNNPLKAVAANASERSILRLQLSNGTTTDEALLVFDKNLSDTCDDYDSPKMMNDAADIYTEANDKKLVINCMKSVKYNMEIPIGFGTLTANDFIIDATEIRNFEAGTQLLLMDKLLSKEVDLSNGATYRFRSEISSPSTDRFSLVLRIPSTETRADKTKKLNAQVFVNAKNQVTIVAPEKATYRIYNTLGQKVTTGETISNHTIVSKPFLPGMYVIRISENGKDFSTKVILK